MMFDLHTLVAISQSWAALSASTANWATAMGAHVPAASAEKWRLDLVGSGVEFITGYTPQSPKVPQIAVALRSESLHSETSSFGFADGIGGTSLREQFVGEVAIRCFADNPEIGRAMHAAVASIMLATALDFLKGGYQDLNYVGGGDLSPEEKLFPNGLNIFAREQRWRAMYTQKATVASTATDLPIIVGPVDVDFTVPSGSAAGGITGDT